MITRSELVGPIGLAVILGLMEAGLLYVTLGDGGVFRQVIDLTLAAILVETAARLRTGWDRRWINRLTVYVFLASILAFGAVVVVIGVRSAPQGPSAFDWSPSVLGWADVVLIPALAAVVMLADALIKRVYE